MTDVDKLRGVDVMYDHEVPPILRPYVEVHENMYPQVLLPRWISLLEPLVEDEDVAAVVEWCRRAENPMLRAAALITTSRLARAPGEQEAGIAPWKRAARAIRAIVRTPEEACSNASQ